MNSSNIVIRPSFTITLGNQFQLQNIRLNGSYFVYDHQIDESTLKNGLDKVSISDGKTNVTYTDMQLIEYDVIDGKTWFMISEKSYQQKKEDEINDQILSLTESILNLQFETDMDRIDPSNTLV